MKEIKELEKEIIELEKKALAIEKRRSNAWDNRALLNECYNEKEKNEIALDIAKSKYRLALFDRLDPIVREVLEKYKGKAIGEKRRAMLNEELNARCPFNSMRLYAYTGDYGSAVSVNIHSDHLTNSSGYDWTITTTGEIRGTRPRAFEGTALEMQKAYEDLEALCDELQKKLTAYNDKCSMLPGFYTTVAGYGRLNNSRHF